MTNLEGIVSDLPQLLVSFIGDVHIQLFAQLFKAIINAVA